MKNRWYSVLLLGLVLLLVTLNIGCPTCFSQDDLDAAYADGYETGTTEGLAAGYDSGYIAGLDDGYDDGYNIGYVVGLSDGRSAGYTFGYIDGKADGYAEGYEVGYGQAYYEITGLSITNFSIEITFLTSPIGPGYYATLTAKTLPYAWCDITVTYASGPSGAPRSGPAPATRFGRCTGPRPHFRPPRDSWMNPWRYWKSRASRVSGGQPPPRRKTSGWSLVPACEP